MKTTARSVAILLTMVVEGISAEAPPEASRPDQSALASLSLDELSSIQVETVFGASKHEQDASDAPASVSIVTADDIKKSGYRTLTGILNSVRGFYTTSDRSYSYIGVRGFNRPGDYGGDILIMIDGHRLNDAIYDQAFNGTEFLLDVDLIERVEVIRGPGSSLYGDNAFLCIINVVTRRGLSGVEAAGAYASYNTATGRLSYGNRFKSGVALEASGTCFASDGHDRLHYPEFSRINHGYADNIDSSHGGSAFATVSFRDFSLEGGFVQRTKTLPTAAYGTVFGDPRNCLLNERAFAELKYQHEFEDEWRVAARLYYDQYHYGGNFPEPEYAYGDPRYPGVITMNCDRSDQESLGGEIQLTKVLLDRHRLTGGVECRRDFVLDQRNFDVAPPATYISTNMPAYTVGCYAQDEYSILDNLILNAGGRYDYFSFFGDTLNPRVALIYKPWTNSVFKAIYGQAFRAPNAYEMYYVAPGYASNTQLRPETIRSYELVYEQTIIPQVRWTSSVFYNDIHDLISFGTNAAGTSVFGNIDSATSLGAEAELEGHWGGGWRTRASYTYADARDASSGQRLSNSPEHAAKLNLTAPLWHEKIFLNLEVLGLSSRLTGSGGTVGGYSLVNVTLLSLDIVKGLEASASIYNLFDQHYSDPVSSDFRQSSIAQDGRDFRIKLTCRF